MQAAGKVWPAVLLYVPAPQAVHKDAANAELYVPAAQMVHPVVDVVIVLYRPAGQAVQAADEVDELPEL